MKSSEIRQEFLGFFREKGHEIVRSASLVPKGDPSLLFTNAGMVQFKDYFLGRRTPPYKRAATSQKCLRAGGKQSDIQNVGYTARHHTFFEMLGNFSFGDYFKRDAIIFAWELFTKRFKLPKERLWVTIFRDDDEAEALWRENTDISSDRIIRLGEKDNFWQMGDTGPCGPCSEIIFDQGGDVGCRKTDCAVGCDCDRFLELWNLVFMQFERNADGSLTKLPNPSIDTGMGLERISSILQGKKSNFDTDLFVPIIKAITNKTQITYGRDNNIDSSIRIIADHIRAVTFMLSDGVIPSNEGRGYVLRKIIRRAVAHSRLIGIETPFFHTIMDDFIEFFSDVYPEIKSERDTSYEFLKQEELGFFSTLDRALLRYQEIKDKVIGNEFKGSDAFLLSDTFGMPREIIEDMTKRDGVNVDWQGYEAEMETQRERSKRQVFAGDGTRAGDGYAVKNSFSQDVPKTQFTGYNELETKSGVKFLIKNSVQANELKKGEEGELYLDKTPFYGESGGQAGDKGVIKTDNAEIEVLNTTKDAEGHFIHHVKVKKGTIIVGDNVRCEVDRLTRDATKRNHTATHLLHAALRELFGSHIKQAGSSVSPERLRFDYTHFKQLEYEDRIRLQRQINDKILENLPAKTIEMSIDEAMFSGATALFGEKYGDIVRVVEINGYSKELCGGTHCSATSEIGSFIIISEGSIGSGLRRIEAVTGIKAIEYVERRLGDIAYISDILNTENPRERVEVLYKRVKQLERELEETKVQGASGDISNILSTAYVFNGIKVLITRKDGLNIKQLREFCDLLRDGLGSGVIFAASVDSGQAGFISIVTKDLLNRFHAGHIIEEASKIAGGRGGGRSDMAQGGTKDCNKVEQAMERVLEMIKDSLK